MAGPNLSQLTQSSTCASGCAPAFSSSLTKRLWPQGMEPMTSPMGAQWEPIFANVRHEDSPGILRISAMIMMFKAKKLPYAKKNRKGMKLHAASTWLKHGWQNQQTSRKVDARKPKKMNQSLGHSIPINFTFPLKIPMLPLVRHLWLRPRLPWKQPPAGHRGPSGRQPIFGLPGMARRFCEFLGKQKMQPKYSEILS